MDRWVNKVAAEGKDVSYDCQVSNVVADGRSGTSNESQPESAGKEMFNTPPCGESPSMCICDVMRTILAIP